jgi:hypothetical protein
VLHGVVDKHVAVRCAWCAGTGAAFALVANGLGEAIFAVGAVEQCTSKHTILVCRVPPSSDATLKCFATIWIFVATHSDGLSDLVYQLFVQHAALELFVHIVNIGKEASRIVTTLFAKLTAIIIDAVLAKAATSSRRTQVTGHNASTAQEQQENNE